MHCGTSPISTPHLNTKEQGLSPALLAIGLDDNLFNRIHDGEPFSICYHLEYNTWQGKTN